MLRFSSVVDDITFEKIKKNKKSVKFYLCDEKRSGLSVNDSFYLLNKNNEGLSLLVKNIEVSRDLNSLIRKFSLKDLGESDYNSAYLNIKQWFSNSDIKKYSIMAVSVEVMHE